MEENTTGCGIKNFLGYFSETVIEDFDSIAIGQIVTMAVSEHFLHTMSSIVVQVSSQVFDSASLSLSSHVFASPVSDKGNIIRRTALFLRVSVFEHIADSEEFVNVFVRISFGSAIKLGVGADNWSEPTWVNSSTWIEIFENHEKVTELVDVENWRIINSRVLRWVVSLIERKLFCFVDEVFDSEYVQVQVMVQQVQNWKHVYASKGEFGWGQFARKLYGDF
ncbi:hypothetical protein Tco_0047661 [Tanacetum coccineum]